jgi:predicted Zn-dependent peptidase
MANQEIRIHTFDNGLTLIVEPMTDVQSAAFSMLLPAGSVYDSAGKNGSAAILSDLAVRGAGARDSKQLSTDLDNLGLQRSEGVGVGHVTFSGATLASRLPDALRIYGDIVRRPHLETDQFEAARMGVEQSLTALIDEPRQRLFQELGRRSYDAPWGHPSEGSLDDLPSISIEDVRRQFESGFRPNGMILGIAGNIDANEIQDLVGEMFSDWQQQAVPELTIVPADRSHQHIEHDSTQTHIGIACDTVPYKNERYYDAWAAVSVLSGGMSSRLFTEVREKRGLCYAINASLNSLPDEARVVCYAGSMTDRAQETLDVTMAEFHRLPEGIADEELDRCKARAKSSLVMQQESTSARSSAMARDWFHLGRITTLNEVRERIDALDTNSVMEFLEAHPFQNYTILTIGAKALNVT